MEELQKQVVQWAQDKGLLNNVSNYTKNKQSLKVIEEIGETAGAYLKGNIPELIDGIGDIAVTLIILAAMYGHEITIDSGGNESMGGERDLFHIIDAVGMVFSDGDPFELNFAMSTLALFASSNGQDLVNCLQSAYDVISKRTGKMVDGTFIKDVA